MKEVIQVPKVITLQEALKGLRQQTKERIVEYTQELVRPDEELTHRSRGKKS